MKPPELLDRLSASLHAITTDKVKLADDRPAIALDELIRRARHVVACANTAGATADGYPTKTPGASDSVGTDSRPCDQPGCSHWTPCPVHPPEPEQFTATERAAVARLAGSKADPVAVMAQTVMRNLAAAVKALDDTRHALDRFDAYRDTATIADAPQCWLATRYELPWDEEWTPFRTTDFKGKLDEPWPEPRKVAKCEYYFVYNNPTLRRVPTKTEMLRHLERGVINVKVAS